MCAWPLASVREKNEGVPFPGDICVVAIACLRLCSSERLQKERAEQGMNMWGSLWTWRWGVQRDLSKGNWPGNKTCALTNKTPYKRPFLFFLPHFSICGRFIFPSLSLFFLSWSPESIKQCHSHTGRRLLIYTERWVEFSFKRSHHFVGLTEKIVTLCLL